MTRKVSAEVDLVHQQTQNQRYGSSHIGSTAKDISNVVTDAASGVVDIFHGIDKAVADTWNNFWNFFFKQKTAYDIDCDWSSDVCSSDLSSRGRCVPVKILVVGSGGREHALVWKRAQSAGVDNSFCAPGNAGTALLAENVEIKAGDLAALARFAKENRIDLTVIGPDDSLAAGIVDVFEGERLRVFGPSKTAARLESSKIFAKELMRAKRIPTARAAIFEKPEAAVAFLKESHFPIVIKADGLALGKGVIVAQEFEEARVAVDAMLSEGRFGDAGRRLLIEECLAGTECSLHALVDGKNFLMLASARDHKRAFDGDAGPNTGGMGAFSPANHFCAEAQAQFEGAVMRPLLDCFR